MNHQQSDDWASTPEAYVVVALGVAALIFGTWAITSSWPVWAVAVAVFVCAPVVGAALLVSAARHADRSRTRHACELARAAAHQGRPPGAPEVLDDFGLARTRFLNIPNQRQSKD